MSDRARVNTGTTLGGCGFDPCGRHPTVNPVVKLGTSVGWKWDSAMGKVYLGCLGDVLNLKWPSCLSQ